VAPLLPFVPWVIPANIITIISNFFVYIGFFVAYYFHEPWNRLIVAACLFLYLVGDHLDGMQAKRTKTGSALGEFCDHYLDAFNNGIILFTAFLVFKIYDPILIGIVLTTSYLAHMSVFYEQFKTGWLTFERLGSLEAVLLISCLIAFSSLDVVYNIFVSEVFSSYRVIDIAFLLSAVGAAVTFTSTIKRIPGKSIQVWLFVLGIVMITVFCAAGFTGMQLFVVITLYASLYVGLIMRGHLVDGFERIPDLVIPCMLAFQSILNQIEPHTIFLLTTIYLSARIMLLVVQTFNSLKIYWVWSNPRV